ncbi:unnamed protein product [Ectocarpus sp. 4 AP-2014]
MGIGTGCCRWFVRFDPTHRHRGVTPHPFRVAPERGVCVHELFSTQHRLDRARDGARECGRQRQRRRKACPPSCSSCSSKAETSRAATRCAYRGDLASCPAVLPRWRRVGGHRPWRWPPREAYPPSSSTARLPCLVLVAHAGRDGPQEPASREPTKLFRRRYRIPYQFFTELMELVKKKKWFPMRKKDVAGRMCISVELKILSSLHILGRGNFFEDMSQASHMSEGVIQAGFHKFTKLFAQGFHHDRVCMFTGEDQDKVMEAYDLLGFTGAIG